VFRLQSEIEDLKEDLAKLTRQKKQQALEYEKELDELTLKIEQKESEHRKRETIIDDLGILLILFLLFILFYLFYFILFICFFASLLLY
jgi:hypothetical protein